MATSKCKCIIIHIPIVKQYLISYREENDLHLWTRSNYVNKANNYCIIIKWHGKACKIWRTSTQIWRAIKHCMKQRVQSSSWSSIVWTIRTIRAFAFANDWNIRGWKTPLKNDKYHTFEITIYYELNKPKKWKKNKKISKKMGKKQNKKHKNVWITFTFVFIRFPTYENECYAKRTRILRTMLRTIRPW